MQRCRGQKTKVEKKTKKKTKVDILKIRKRGSKVRDDRKKRLKQSCRRHICLSTSRGYKDYCGNGNKNEREYNILQETRGKNDA